MEVLLFLKENWQYVAPLLLLLVELILFLCKKRSKVEILDPGIFKLLIKWIKEAEIDYGPEEGVKKLEYVLHKYELHSGIEMTEYIASVISGFVDSILDTPTRKGGLGREEVK